MLQKGSGPQTRKQRNRTGQDVMDTTHNRTRQMANKRMNTKRFLNKSKHLKSKPFMAITYTVCLLCLTFTRKTKKGNSTWSPNIVVDSNTRLTAFASTRCLSQFAYVFNDVYKNLIGQRCLRLWSWCIRENQEVNVDGHNQIEY